MTAGASSTTRAATSAERDGTTPGLHLLGVRHHGPGSARSVVRALDEVDPAIVLVELPADASALLGWIGHPGLRPPVALLGYLATDVARAAFWPLAEFSPEWQAVRWALAHDRLVRAIDAPAGWSLGLTHDDRRARERVDPLAALAAAAGEPDAERWWDDVVEHRGDGVPAFAAVGEAMAAVRAGTSTSDSDARREAHMRRAVRTALAEAGQGAVAVVCGAWHVPALDPTRATASSDARLATAPPGAGRATLSWVPWSDRKLEHAAGYAAGVAWPGWYRHVFRNPGPDGVTRFFVEAAAGMRARGLAVSPDHLIAAARLADALAALRDRPRPGLDEVRDAATTVVGGVSGTLPPVIDDLTRGTAVGAVPPEAPQVPLVGDVAREQKRARLRPTVGARRLELDLRTPLGLRRSHLLHRLDLLAFDWGQLAEGRGARGTFRETWDLDWDPAALIRLVECAGQGTTLVEVATATVVERTAATTRLAEAASLVSAALLADLPGAVVGAARSLGELAARAPDVAELIDALVPLAQALRYGDVRGSDASALTAVVDEMVVRVIAGLDGASRRLDDDAAAAMVERLSGLQAALALLDHPARRRDLPEALVRLADSHAVHGLVRGRATRLLHDGGTWSPDDVSRRVGRALTAGTPAADGARFLEGFLAGSGTVLVHDRDLLDVIDAWISSMPGDVFTDALVLLRRTFGAFEPAERRQLGVLTAGAPAAVGDLLGDGLDAERVRAGLHTVRLLLGLPVHDDGSGDG